MDFAAPKFFYFDLGNVLLTFDHHTACVQLSSLVNLRAARIWEILFAGRLQSRYERGAISSREVYEAFCRGSLEQGGHRPGYDEFHRANSDIFQLHLPLMPIVVQLHVAGYPLGILSNTCEAHWNHIFHCRFPALRQLFGVAVLSYQEQISKPDQGIYAAAVEQAGTAARDVFFVDDREENVRGAAQAGLDAVRFHTPQQLARDLRARGVRFNY